ncbi:MAG: outer membrane protein transport protein [Halofilum sp. (in: g-proteobacteria)]|nr:outer membrane protein transport protein [Halofilum sp. (in: g-proteobacteria)]
MPRSPMQHSSLVLAFSVALLPGTAAAASFQILEQSPALQGTSFAGTASSAQDASTVFFNPAAMTELEGSHFSLGGNLIMPEAAFDNDGSTNTGGGPLQGPDDKTDETGFVPNLYYVRPINDRWTFGLGVNAPFGLASSYDKDWVGRYHATDSELQVLNINPTFAYRASDRVSLGVGINYQRIDATLEQQVDSFTACVAAGRRASRPVARSMARRSRQLRFRQQRRKSKVMTRISRST